MFKTFGDVKGKICSSKGQQFPTGGGEGRSVKQMTGFSVMHLFMVADSAVVSYENDSDDLL